MKVASADEEIASIHAILDPAFGYVGTCRQPFHGLMTGRIPGGPYTFEMLVFPSLDVLAKAGKPREVRAMLLAHAEDALDAVGAAGWHLTSYPRMEFSGGIERFKADGAGKIWKPSRQDGIGLKMCFDVDRPR